MDFDRFPRPLFAALIYSLLLHVLLLLGSGAMQRLPVAGATVAVSLNVVVRAQAPTVAKKVSMEKPASPSIARNERAKLAAAVTRSVVTARTLSVVKSHARAQTSSVLSSVSASSSVAKSGDGAVASEVAPRAVPNEVPIEGISADGLRQYRIDLAVSARRFRAYPAMAHSSTWEGATEITISLSPGLTPRLSLLRSSGHAVLDEQALSMLASAAAQTPLPAALRGRSFSVPIVLRFSLND